MAYMSGQEYESAAEKIVENYMGEYMDKYMNEWYIQYCRSILNKNILN